MLSRDDFVFTIGFDGDSAVVDRRAKVKYRALSTMKLAEAGLFRAAYASALLSGDPREMEEFLRYYDSVAGTTYSVKGDASRLFGVARENITKTLEL